ncbi:MAG: sigma-54 dependent transcriptional regulator [Acidobacteriota bacterium]|jgi:DNA-binding NtrC family response regulator
MSSKKPKVLVVDDQPSVRNALEVMLDVHGIDHAAAPGPEEALEILAREEIGVVIQDMNFGRQETSGREGTELFRRIREVQPDVPVLLMTAWASLESAVQLIKEGATDYIQKPWDDDKLLVTLKNLLEMRRLQLENARLQDQGRHARQELRAKHDLCGIVYESDELHKVVSLAISVARSDAPVLITGPSGAGKEKLAEIVQANSRRRKEKFLRVNVGALPQELMESELFGAEAGAYTGATSRRIGHFETADGGTLFLDEIDALPLSGQVKLLRVVQSGEFQRLGSSQSRHANVRLISATNSDLEAAVRDGRFREDLFFRLNVIELAVPPLRDRPDDILPLARHFLQEGAAETGAVLELGPDAEQALLAHAWDGNVRELQNRVRRACLTCSGGTIGAAELDLEAGGRLPTTAATAAPRGNGERRKIEAALLEADGNVSRAAEILSLSRQALYRKMDKLGIVLERRPRT